MTVNIVKKTASAIAESISTDKQIDPVVEFGIETAMYKVLHLCTSVLIGMMFGKVLEILVFHLFYQKLRTYAGGHHAKSKGVCFLCSCGIALCTLALWSFCSAEYQIWFTIEFMVVSFPIIWILSPVGAINKPLDEAETAIYRKKARIYLMIETGVVIVLLAFGFSEIALVGTTALVVLTIMLVLGKMKEKVSPVV